jgi:hypothetical protein
VVATLKEFLVLEELPLKEKAFIVQEDKVFGIKKDSMNVNEHQYRAVISLNKNRTFWKASVQRRISVNEWEKVVCGLKNVKFASREDAEDAARTKIQEQKMLDYNDLSSIRYVIYDD